ncbi:hypothetical protein SAMN05518672_1056 [Chitinophaga sp. CF118]|uniref:hypothetical protein n=1 Tax=Chitinophaga sp. CF118 TaxID=1884367 RepID=UPI0008E89412|nr:hypothetical protein [Chitinophaga sp. CF118]SFE23838.1 hypothetical protein SAMN05518672_1056 [Chitinophaga sp. CF118]
MQYYNMSAGDKPGGKPEPIGVPVREQPPNPGPEITPPPSPQGPPPPIPNEVPDHDIHRTPPNPKAGKQSNAENDALIAEQDREDVQERSPDLLNK